MMLFKPSVACVNTVMGVVVVVRCRMPSLSVCFSCASHILGECIDLLCVETLSVRGIRQEKTTYTVSLRGAKGKEEVLQVPSDRYILDIADEKVGKAGIRRAKTIHLYVY